MEVTNTNFKEILPKVEDTINKATFLAIDCEFSGLNVVSEINAYDTPRQYYEKVRKNCKEFLVLQYGISAFRFDPEINGFKQQSYNFYIFRRPVNRNIPDQRFLCQTSSINFLTNQGFDFNKLFKFGISYLNIAEETDYRDRLEDKQKLRNSQSSLQQSQEIIQIPDELQPVIDETLKQLDEFLDTDSLELELPKCNAFVRRLIYQSTAQKYKNKLVLSTKQLQNKIRVLVATKCKSKEEQDKIEQKLFEEELTILDDFIGFTKVLRLIVDSGKLVVGHNMCLDFFHTLDKFLTPLPEDYEEFKECAHSLFKNILDTKFMANSEDFKDLITSTVLKDLLETVSKDPFELPPVEIEDGGEGYSREDEKEHEAGYDAYITGLCFLSMWKYLGKTSDKSSQSTFSNFTLLEPFMNRLFLMMLKDNQYIHLGGQDPNPSRDHVFFLTFPKDWKLNNIIELFSPFGSVYVAWINENSAYVGLYKKDQAAVALNTLSQSDTYKIMTYSKRQAQISGVEVTLTPPEPKNRRKRTIGNSTKSNKKMKIDHFGQGSRSKMFESAIEEESGGFDTHPKNTKTFIESDAWD